MEIMFFFLIISIAVALGTGWCLVTNGESNGGFYSNFGNVLCELCVLVFFTIGGYYDEYEYVLYGWSI